MMSDWSQAAKKDCSTSWEMAEEFIGGQSCSCRATPGSCRCDLSTAEGWKGAAMRGEGRNLYCDDRNVERSNLSTFKPTRCRDLSAAERRSARRQRFVVRAGRRHLLCYSAPLGTRFARLGRAGPCGCFAVRFAHPTRRLRRGRISLWVAPTRKGRLRYSALKISTCLYLFYMVKYSNKNTVVQG